MPKRAWISSIAQADSDIKTLISVLKQYGIEGHGHVWTDDVDKMSWMGPREELLKNETAMWIILASREEIQTKSILYGLSLLALTVQAKRGSRFPILVISKDSPVKGSDLPAPLHNASLMTLNETSLGPKTVALAHSKKIQSPASFYCDVYGNPRIGQWFEVGPSQESWAGAVFAASEGEILFHAVGSRGILPERSTLEYPYKGITMELNGQEYSAWACQNRLSENESYFVKVEGHPGSILFGPFADKEDPELFVLNLV